MQFLHGAAFGYYGVSGVIFARRHICRPIHCGFFDSRPSGLQELESGAGDRGTCRRGLTRPTRPAAETRPSAPCLLRVVTVRDRFRRTCKDQFDELPVTRVPRRVRQARLGFGFDYFCVQMRGRSGIKAPSSPVGCQGLTFGRCSPHRVPRPHRGCQGSSLGRLGAHQRPRRNVSNNTTVSASVPALPGRGGVIKIRMVRSSRTKRDGREIGVACSGVEVKAIGEGESNPLVPNLRSDGSHTIALDALTPRT